VGRDGPDARHLHQRGRLDVRERLWREDLQLWPNGEVAARFAWKYPKGDLNNHEVKAYPSLIAGKKPGYFSTGSSPGGIPIKLPDGSYSGASPSGATPGTFMAVPQTGA
jgi:hypothetical protein